MQIKCSQHSRQTSDVDFTRSARVHFRLQIAQVPRIICHCQVVLSIAYLDCQNTRRLTKNVRSPRSSLLLVLSVLNNTLAYVIFLTNRGPKNVFIYNPPSILQCTILLPKGNDVTGKPQSQAHPVPEKRIIVFSHLGIFVLFI